MTPRHVVAFAIGLVIMIVSTTMLRWAGFPSLGIILWLAWCSFLAAWQWRAARRL